MTYNAQGNPLSERRDLDTNPAGGTGTITVATFAYAGAAGSAGQPTSITDARGAVTTLAYADTTSDFSCDSRGLYPCKITNTLGHEIRRSYALRFGTMTEERDANDARTTLAYDALGRLTKVFRGVSTGSIPGDVKAWREFSYYLGSAGSPATPTRIDVRIREEAHASGYRTEARFHDGLGRYLATKAEAIVAGAAANVVREAVGFDGAGRVAHQYPPYAGGMALTSYDPPSGVATSTVFDLLDRPTQVTGPDGNARTTAYDPAGATDLRDENYVACNRMPGTIARASCPGQRTVEQRDALGRLLTISIYKGATLDSQTINEYDAVDRLTSTKLAADEDTKVTFTYDSFGRRIGLRDKNSGAWTYGYDHSGNLIYQNDPKTGQHLEWCVDALNRPANKRSFTTDAFNGNACGSGGTVRTSFSYDTCTRGVGRLCQENSPGRQLLTRWYTARGLVGAESRSIDAAGPARSLTYAFYYDEADRLKNLQYPTSNSATNETLTYSYDAAGQLVAAATPGNTYLAGAQYDLFGRSTRLDLGGAGSGSTSELRTYFDASGAYRLQQLAVVRASTALQTWNYELPSSAGPGWDRAGNLLKIDDVTPSGQYPPLSDRDNDWS